MFAHITIFLSFIYAIAISHPLTSGHELIAPGDQVAAGRTDRHAGLFRAQSGADPGLVPNCSGWRRSSSTGSICVHRGRAVRGTTDRIYAALPNIVAEAVGLIVRATWVQWTVAILVFGRLGHLLMGRIIAG